MHKTNNRVRRMLFINLANVVYQFYVCRAGRHLSDGQQLTIAGEAYRLIDRQRNSEVRLQFRTAVASFADDLMNSAEQRDGVQRLKTRC